MSTGRDSDPGVSLNSSMTWKANTDSEETLGDIIDREWQEGSTDSDERPGDVIDREWREKFTDSNAFEADPAAAETEVTSPESVIGRE